MAVAGAVLTMRHSRDGGWVHRHGPRSRHGDGVAGTVRGIDPGQASSLRAFSRADGAAVQARGFTLIEIVVVVGLIAVLTLSIATVIGQGLGGARVRAASKDLVAALRYTRSQALVRRESQVLLVDVGKRAYKAVGRDWVALPEDMQMSLLTASQEQLDDQVGQIRFFPDGSSTGGNIELKRGEALWRIDVGWLTGEVRLAAESPR